MNWSRIDSLLISDQQDCNAYEVENEEFQQMC